MDYKSQFFIKYIGIPILVFLVCFKFFYLKGIFLWIAFYLTLLLLKIENKKVEIFSVLFIYFILTCYFTYPLMFKLKDTILGVWGGDSYQFLWNFWYFSKQIEKGVLPLYTSFLFFPKGSTLLFHTMNWFSALLFFIFKLLTNNFIVSYNLVVIFIFVFTAFTMYLVTRAITKNKLVSLFSGTVFSFNVQHLSFAEGWINLFSWEFLPLFLFFIWKFFETKKIELKYLMLIFSFFFLTFLSSYWLTYGAITFLVLMILVINIMKIKKGNVIQSILKSFMVLSPFFFLLFIFQVKGLSLVDIGEIIAYRIEDYVVNTPFLSSFFIPCRPGFYSQLRLFKPWCIDFAHTTTSFFSQQVFMGYSLLFIIFVSVFSQLLKKWKIEKNTLPLILPGVLIFIFMVFPLNPVTYYLLKNKLAPLPYRIYPYFLFSILIYISCYLSQKRWEIVLLLFIWFLVENQFSIILSEAKIPQYYSIIKNDNSNFAIIEFPLWSGQSNEYMFYQTYHEKPMLNGYVSRASVEVESFKKDCKDLLYSENLDKIKNFLISNNFKYLIIHKKYLKDDLLSRKFEKLSKKIYEDNEAIVFKIY